MRFPSRVRGEGAEDGRALDAGADGDPRPALRATCSRQREKGSPAGGRAGRSTHPIAGEGRKRTAVRPVGQHRSAALEVDPQSSDPQSAAPRRRTSIPLVGKGTKTAGRLQIPACASGALRASPVSRDPWGSGFSCKAAGGAQRMHAGVRAGPRSPHRDRSVLKAAAWAPQDRRPVRRAPAGWDGAGRRPASHQRPDLEAPCAGPLPSGLRWA